eukprot:30497-Pelagococcus_subviridis.AAC.43
MRFEVEQGRPVHLAPTHLPHLQRGQPRPGLGLGHEHDRVDVRRLQRTPSDPRVEVGVEPVDDDVQLLPHARQREVLGYVLLLRDQLIPAKLSNRELDLVGVFRRGGAVLFAVSERAEPLELELLAELHEVVVLLLGFPGEAGYERRSQRKPGDSVAKFMEQILRVLPRRPVHSQQTEVRDVLQRDVDVLAHLRNVRDRVDELLAEVRRVRVQNADPLDAVDDGEALQQLREASPV